MGRNKVGLFSEFLLNKHQKKEDSYFYKDVISLRIKSGSFPKIDNQDNVILIATGTGIAPIRSLLWERYLKSKNCQNQGKTVLFFGCRNKAFDFLYDKEYEEFIQSDCFDFEYNFAFSRDQEDKIYVQHLMKKRTKEIYELIFEKNSYILLVGGSKSLPRSVDNTLKLIISEKNKDLNEEDINKIIDKLKFTGRYYIECW
jgi:NADPH-ferrihemoprotein reductase